jgi:ABC-type amino acid transport substrate-binding protein
LNLSGLEIDLGDEVADQRNQDLASAITNDQDLRFPGVQDVDHAADGPA